MKASRQKLDRREMVLGAILLGSSLYVASGLLVPLALGAIIAVLLSPLYRLLKKKVPQIGAAVLVVLAFLVVLVLPISLLLFFGANVAVEQFQDLKDTAESGGSTASWSAWLVDLAPVVQLREILRDYFNVSEKQFIVAIRDMGASFSSWAGRGLGAVLSSMPAVLTALGVTLLSIFFFLMDGHGVGEFLRNHAPLDRSETDYYIERFKELCRSVVLASVLAAVAQSMVYTLACWIAGVDQTLLVGFLVFIAAFIPLLGAAPVTISTMGYLFMTGHITGGVFLAVMVVIVALIDNLVRPLVMKGASDLHPLLAFAGALGGIQTMGFAGVFLGPILVGLASIWIRRAASP